MVSGLRPAVGKHGVYNFNEPDISVKGKKGEENHNKCIYIFIKKYYLGQVMEKKFASSGSCVHLASPAGKFYGGNGIEARMLLPVRQDRVKKSS